MSEYPNARDCEHGQLARVCEVCELQARLAECERAKDDHFMNSCLRANIESLATENDKIRAQLAETQKLLSVQLAVGDKLSAEVARLKQASIVPGVMHCAKCNFELTRVTLYMGNGAVGPGDSNTEPCPNGCGPMWPVTWESRAREQMAVAERFFDEKQKAEAELAALRDFAGYYAECPCCGRSDRCVEECTFAYDAPSDFEVTELARDALGR